MSGGLRFLSRATQYAWLTLFFIFLATPMLVIVVFSFDVDRFPTLPWGGFSLVWHEAAWSDPMVRDSLYNSVVVSLGSAALATALGFAAAYLDYRHNFFGKPILILAVSVPPAVPSAILGMAMLAFVSRIGLYGGLPAIICCHVALATSFAMALIRLRLNEFERDLEPAAWNLGATPWAGLLHVVLPFCRPAIVAAFFLSAAVSFDEFMIAWFVGGVHETLPVRILNQLQGQVNPKVNAMGAFVLAVSVALVTVARSFASLKNAAKAEAP